MTVSRILFGTFVSVALIGAAWSHQPGPRAAMTMNKTSGDSAFDVAVAVKKDWRAELKKKVFEKSRWKWTLEYVEKSGDALNVGLIFRNQGGYRRPMLLEDGYMEKIVLVDEASGATYPLVAVEGVSEQLINIEKGRSGRAMFTFEYPEGVDGVRFTSIWITMMMQGTASVMPVEFHIDLPPKGAKFVG